MTNRYADLPLLSRLLDAALALAPDRVEPWLAALPPDAARLAPALRAALARHRSGPVDDDFLAAGPRLDEPADESVTRPGDRIGPYRVVREIGRGGMGAVWLAERADDDGPQRAVALKLPRLAWGARLAERMARERDIGARLEHPGIARLYDAGVDALGRPYLALEYIDGQPLDAWCADRALGIRARLQLFLQIARAVAYAHGRLVVHRDLKPSNVLVTPDGQAHLLDFGIARLLHEPAGTDSLTQEHDRLLTPRYAAPEQLRGGTVTVASDVYALGVLLYEMLTGRRPHEPGATSLAALEHAVLNDDTPPASSRAADRQTAQALRGELDAILAQALQREPDRRYATVDAFAADVERHLAGERVLAQPDTLRRRVARTLRRHRAGFAAAAAVLVAIVGGAGAAVVEARRATVAADRARAVQDFVVDVFKVNQRGTAGNAELRRLPAELLLEHGARLIETRFAAAPRLQAELYGVVAGIFADMEAHDLAATYAQRQLRTQTAIGAGTAAQAGATMLLARALLAQGRLADALAQAQRALALAGADAALRAQARVLVAQVQFRQGDNAATARTLDAAERDLARDARPSAAGARAKQMRAGILVRANRFDDALPLYRAAIDEALAAEGALSPTAINLRLVAANNLMIQGREREARPYRDAALAALRAGGGAGDVQAAMAEAEIHRVLFLSGAAPFEQTGPVIERDLATVVARGTLLPPRIRARIEFDLGTVLANWGDPARAEAYIARSVAVLAPQAEDVRDRFQFTGMQAEVLTLLGRHDEAAALYRETIRIQDDSGGGSHPDRIFEYAREALNRSMQGRHAAAEAVLASAPRFEAMQGVDAAQAAIFRDGLRRTLARIKLERGLPAEALALLPPAADDADDAPYPFDNLLLRGEVLCALGRHGEGLPLLERSLALHAAKDYPHSPHLARARAVTGVCAVAAGQRREAAALAAQARASFAERPDVSRYFKQPLERLDVLLQAPRR